MHRLNSEDFSKIFLCQDILFLTFSYGSTHQEVLKNAEFFRLFLNIHDYFDFFEVFRMKLFCTVSYSYVLCSISFPIKFRIELFMSLRWEALGENAITCFIGFTGFEIA